MDRLGGHEHQLGVGYDRQELLYFAACRDLFRQPRFSKPSNVL